MTEPNTDLVERLQEWADRAADPFHPKGWVCTVHDALIADLRSVAAELTTSRATCARLQEDMQTLAAEGYYLEERVTKAEAQVATLTAERDEFKRIGQGFERDYRNTFEQSCKNLQRAETLTAALRRYGQHEKSCDALLSTDELRGICTCGFDAVLRAASESP